MRELMPTTDVVMYREDDGSVPLRDWLDGLPSEASARCLARLALLHEKGHELRRPHAENIGKGLYELRVKFGHVNLRMLYFFHGRTVAVVSHGFAKEQKLPPSEIALAQRRMEKFQKSPARHTFIRE
jgi:phage-related protein